MLVLVINCGSSSLKLALVSSADGRSHAQRTVQRVPRGGHAAALADALPDLLGDHTPDVVGHRVVHGGDRFSAPVRIDPTVEAAIADLSALAPLHNPANLAGIRAARELLPDLLHVAVFDTAFHSTLPHRAQRYALPLEMAEKHGVRRYGFHGPSHQYVSAAAAQHLGTPIDRLRLITCHLGSGASVSAVEYGRSVETSMGMTPLEGLVMGTRSGDVDPGALLHLARVEGLDIDGLDTLLNRESGLLGLAGVNDMRDIEERAADGDERARAALHAFCHRLRKYIGAYAAVMGGVDAIVFTAGIGENSALVRHRAAQRLEFLGAVLDEDRNRDARVGPDTPVAEIGASHGRCRLLVVATNEAHAIAKAASRIAQELDRVPIEAPPIPVAISARHVHLTADAVRALFGEGHKLTPRTWLSQPGQFSCEERVTLIGPKRTIERVGIIGPVRRACQIEISRTDEFHLGIDAPIRRSGDVENTPGITLQGPAGRLTLEDGVVQAWRHIHMQPADAAIYGVEDGDVVSVAVDSNGRDLVYGDVLVRVKGSYRLEMHIDTDEANAANLSRGDVGMLAATSGTVRVVRKNVRWKPA
ncbi:MAG: acetate/propionate family kinase [Deltaproteobacteria bacterium]|nr:acetate/propionate family kinase [Deltaproteobacteria bacterium]